MTTNDASSQFLLEQARRGDRDAINRLLSKLRPYLSMVVRTARSGRYLAGAGDSDMVQDVMLQASRHLDQFQGTSVGQLVAWLRVIATRETHRKFRKATGRDSAAVGELPDEFVAVDQLPEPSALAMRHERAVRMADALNRLPADMQQVLLCRLVDGLEHSEIAARMDRSAGAVRVLFLRSMQRLREVCGSEEQWLSH